MRLAEFRLFLNTRYSELNLRRVRPGKHDAERLIYTLGDFFWAQFQPDGELTNYPHSTFAPKGPAEKPSRGAE